MAMIVKETTEMQRPSFKIGQYLYFARFNGHPILWRIIHIDGAGDLFLLSERILVKRVFDTERSTIESMFNRFFKVKPSSGNFWSDSELRNWLNSLPEWLNKVNRLYQGKKRDIAGISTTLEKTYDTIKKNIKSAVDTTGEKKGFLSNDHFHALELAAIKPYFHRVLVSVDNRELSSGGKMPYQYQTDISVSMENPSAYYVEVTDQVVVPSAQMLKRFVTDRGWDPKAEFVAHDGSRTYTDYLLTCPHPTKGRMVRCINESGMIGEIDVLTQMCGVRPALQLYKDYLYTKSGNGSLLQPFVLVAQASSPIHERHFMRLGDHKIQIEKENY